MWDELSDVRKYNYPDTFQKHDWFKEIIFIIKRRAAKSIKEE
jgi:hypothetical protein